MNKKGLLALFLALPLISGCFNNPQTPGGDEEDDPIVETWSNNEINIFNEHLNGFVMPFESGFIAEYDQDNDCVVVTSGSIELEAFNNYVNGLVNLGFNKENGPYENTYIVSKDILIEGVNKHVEIDIYYQDNKLNAICYDPYVYEWVDGFIPYIFEEIYYVSPTVVVPEVPGDRFIYNTGSLMSKGVLSIICESQTNTEAAYTLALETNGFTVSDDKDADGFYLATESDEVVDIYFGYFEDESALYFVMQPHPGWPTAVVDYYTNQITGKQGTLVPGVKGCAKYEFIESAFDSHGYFFVLCETDVNLEETYKESLLDADYTVFDDGVNTQGNYFAISDDEDLFVQYKYVVVESIMGGDPYKHFDVMFEPYYKYNAEHVAQGLQLIAPGTTTEIPQYPGLGERVLLSDNDIYMYVTIQGATYDSVSTYLETLDEAGWNILPIYEQIYNYEAISPNRDIRLETSVLDGRITLTFSAYEDEYSEWPTDGINEIKTTLNLTGTIPEFENAFGFDYENGKQGYYDVVCFVKTNNEQDLIDAYIEKLLTNDWFAVEDGDYIFYVHEGYTIALRPYTEYEGSGKVFIDISYGDGTLYDIDARDAFSKWKTQNDIDSDVTIPGINITEECKEVNLYYDAGQTYPGYELFELIVNIGETDTAATINEVLTSFTNDGWVYSSTDDAYHKGDLWMTSYEWEGKVAIDICASIPEKNLLTVIREFISDCGLGNSVALPESINIADTYIVDIDSYDESYIDLALYLEFETITKANNAYTVIINALKGAGWSQVTSTKSSVTLTDEGGLLELYIGKNSDVILITIESASSWW